MRTNAQPTSKCHRRSSRQAQAWKTQGRQHAGTENKSTSTPTSTKTLSPMNPSRNERRTLIPGCASGRKTQRTTCAPINHDPARKENKSRSHRLRLLPAIAARKRHQQTRRRRVNYLAHQRGQHTRAQNTCVARKRQHEETKVYGGGA